ncbi:MAG: hypothetical protein JOZ31_18800 [Verrucomicrobia bacterium]|nr:hypothetical protein [Verrucomicrobiota bacterium]
MNDSRLAVIALVGLAVIGVLLIFLFPGSPEQDVDYHFLMARTAWVDHSYFVDVWGRPLFTTLFAAVAWLGFIPARFCALAISVAVAWQTYRLAGDLRMPRAWLVMPLLLGQQTFFELFSNLFTEPLFALVLVIALRCHIRGRIKSGLLVASFLPLARPEGVFVCLFWGLWVALDVWRLEFGVRDSADRESAANARERSRIARTRSRPSAMGSIVILASGVVIWWLAALLLTGDPLFILHNWPATWHTGMYGHGSFLSYGQRSQEFAGVILIVPFALGLLRRFRSRSWGLITSVFLVLFLLHSVFVKYGLFGEAGFPRYMVSVAPAIAVLTLEGWNTIFSVTILRPLATIAGWVVITFSVLQSVHYLDGMTWARDAGAIDEMVNREWIQPSQGLRRDGLRMDANRSVPGLIWSNARMCIALDRSLKDSPPVMSRERLLARLEKAPVGTIVFWDDEIGPNWFGTSSAEIEDRGYKLVTRRHYSLPALVFPPGRFPWIASLFPPIRSREIELSLLQKTTTNGDHE